MRSNTIIKNYDFLLVLFWGLFLLRIIAMEVLFSESSSLWSYFLNIWEVVFFGLGLFAISGAIVRATQFSFAYRFFSLFYPTVFGFLSVPLLEKHFFFIPELCLFSCFLLLMQGTCHKGPKSKLFLNGVLFGIPLLFDWHYLLFVPILLVCMPLNPKVSMRRVVLFVLSVGFCLYLYYSFLYLSDVTMVGRKWAWQFDLPPFSNHLYLGLWGATFSTPLILFLPNASKSFSFQSYLFLSVLCCWLDYWFQGQTFLIFSYLILLHIWALLADSYRKLATFFLLLTLILGTSLFFLY